MSEPTAYFLLTDNEAKRFRDGSPVEINLTQDRQWKFPIRREGGGYKLDLPSALSDAILAGASLNVALMRCFREK